jgi:hypothetical protein
VKFLTKIRTILAGPTTATPHVPSDWAPAMDPEHMLELTAPSALQLQLVARWEVGLFPDAAGRLAPRLQARWQVQDGREWERAVSQYVTARHRASADQPAQERAS